MKRINFYLFITMAMLMLSFNSAWAQYVKVTNGETVSWIEIEGTINGTNIEIYKGNYESAIDKNTKGSIDLNEVWSESGGIGTHYQVTSIGDWAFSRCGHLTSVVIPSSVSSIDDFAFYYCSGLTSVDIPSSVTSIGYAAFSYCSGLTSVVIPSSVTSIDDFAFRGCSGLISIVVESGNSVYDSRNYCNAIIETASNTLIAGCKNTMIPSSVMSIGDWAFGYCSGLTSVVIPSSVTSMGECAFSGCSGLTSITIPNSVTSIGRGAFENCSGLSSIEIPSSVISSIGDYAFYGCSSLTSITIPNSVTSIGEKAFYGCSSLTSVTIGNNVTSIGDNAFQGLNLTSITIPNSVTSIGESAFSDCSGLTSVAIGNGVTTIGSSAFSNCTGLTSITIPSSVTRIGQEAFSGCSGLNKVIVTDIAAWCNISFINRNANPLFIAHHLYSDENTEITKLIIPYSVTRIGSSAFYQCTGLTSVEIPSSVTSIGQYAFYGCSGLTSITSYITDIFETGTNAFFGCNNATLYVQKGLLNFYRLRADWNRIKNIEEMSGVISGAFIMSCNNKGKVQVNGTTEFTNNVGEVSVMDGEDNTFVFTPEENCQLEQVLIDGLDVTLSVKNNQLITKVHENSKMIVTFSKSSGDMNGDGMVNISDVVALVNLILGQ